MYQPRKFNRIELESFLKANKKINEIYVYSNQKLHNIFMANSFGRTGRFWTVIIDLTLSTEELWRDLNRKRRNGIRFAIKNRVIVDQAEWEDLEEFKKVWIEGFCKKFRFETQSADERVRDWISGKVLFVARLDGKIIAGTKIRIYDNRFGITYSVNSSLKEFQKFKPNDLLIWEIIKWAKQKGYNDFNLAGENLFKREFTKKGPTLIEKWIK